MSENTDFTTINTANTDGSDGTVLFSNGKDLGGEQREYYALAPFWDFACLMDKCPDTCCRGWQVIVDDNSLERIKQDKSPLGGWVRLHIARWPNQVLKKNLCGRCAFEAKDQRCKLHRDGHIELMPLVCQLYPRRTVVALNRVETSVELACPAVAKAFLENAGNRIDFEPNEIPVVTPWTLGNSNEDFLKFILDTRGKILDVIWDESLSINQVFFTVFRYCMMLQHQLLVNDDNRYSIRDRELEELIQKVRASQEDPIFLDFEFLDKCLVYNIYDFALSYANPRLYKRIKKYKKIFDNLSSERAKELYVHKMGQFMRYNKNAHKKYRSYLSYLILQLYITAYEDYYLISQVVLPIIYTSQLMLCDLVRFINDEAFDIDTDTLELASLEKRMRHNPEVADGMLNRFRAVYEERLKGEGYE